MMGVTGNGLSTNHLNYAGVKILHITLHLYLRVWLHTAPPMTSFCLSTKLPFLKTQINNAAESNTDAHGIAHSSVFVS